MGEKLGRVRLDFLRPIGLASKSWTRAFAIVDFHQSDRCLLKSSGQQTLIFLERISTASGAKVSFDVTCDCVFGAA